MNPASLLPSYNTLVVLAGTSLLGAGAGLIGCYAVLRRRALLGDALAHASLPGICAAFLLWGQRNAVVLLLGALVSGLLGVLVVSLLRWSTRIKEDAAIGIVLGVFFGGGIALWRVIQNTTTTGSKAGLTSYLLGKTAGMLAQDVYLIAAVSAGCLIVVLALYKEFKLVAFDQAFAQVQGWPALSLDLLLTGLVAVMVVIGLQAVGVVLMAAMLIMPGVSARFWTDRLGKLLALSTLIGALVGAGGTALSAQFRLTPGGPVIVLVGATVFTFSALLAPRRGILARKLADRAFSQRWEEQRLLSRLLEPTTVAAASGDRRARSIAARDRLLHAGAVELTADGQYRLTSAGRTRAERVARGRKLWERFVLEYPELAGHYADLDVESVDEILPASLIEELAGEAAGERVMHWIAEHPVAVWIVIAGAVASANCAILGCFLVLRRMSLLGDAISHAVLPGIVVAFLLAGRSTLAIFAAAIVIGLLTAFCTQSLHSLAKVPEDAAMGIVFTSLFALGVFLLTNFARDVDLDPDCVLYGHIEFLAIDTIDVRGWQIPRAMQTLGLALLATLAFVGLFWKELKIASFDPELASAIGVRAGLIHYLLMAMVALVTVAAFEAVGSVLVIAMLIVPAATAQLLTDRLDRMMVWAVAVSIVSAVAGELADLWLDTGVTGMMAVAAGAQFALAVLLAPRHGLLAKVLGNFALTLRIVGEDVIGLIYRASEAGTAAAEEATVNLKQCARTVGGGLTAWLAILDQWRRGDVAFVGGGRVALTPAGHERAGSLVRAHRLWEAYLGEHFQLPLDHLHAPAERIEHFIGPHLQDRLAAELHAPATDPHGRSIPETKAEPAGVEEKAESGKRKAEQS